MNIIQEKTNNTTEALNN